MTEFGYAPESRNHQRILAGEFGRHEVRGIWGAIAGLAAAALSAGAGAYSASQAGKGGKAKHDTPWLTQVPQPPYAVGGQSYLARLLAENAGERPQSFRDWVAGGGEAKPMLGAGQYSPLEAAQLGMTDKWGQAIPFYDPTTNEHLTPEQAMYLSKIRQGQGMGAGPYGRDEAMTQRLNHLRALLAGGGFRPGRTRDLQTRISRLTGRKARLEDQLSGGTP